MTGWDQGNGGSWNEERKLESDAPQVWLYRQVESRNHNEGQSPSGDVVGV